MGKASRRKKAREPLDAEIRPGAAAPPAADPPADSQAPPWFTPALWGILAAAALFRVAYFLQFQAQSVFFDLPFLDAHIYHSWAQQILGGEWRLAEPFYFAPGYPYVVALIYAVSGVSPAHVYIFQMALGLANIVLIHRLAALAYGRRPAAVAAALAALYASFPFLEAKVMSSIVALTLFLAATLVLADAGRRKGWWRWPVAGVLMGLTSLVRPEALLVSPFLAAWIALWARPAEGGGSIARRHRPAAAATALLAAGWVLAISPVALHNMSTGGGSTLISSQGGITFYQSNNARARGLYVFLSHEGFSGAPELQANEEKEIAEKALGRELSRSEVSSYWFGKGLDFIKSDPGRFVWLLGMKLLRFVGSYEYSTEYIIYVERETVWLLWLPFVPFALLAALAAPSIWSGIRTARSRTPRPPGAWNETGWLLFVMLVANLAACLMFYISSRYRLPSAPPLMIFGGATLVAILDAWRRGRRFDAMAAAGVVAVIFLLAHFPKDESATIQEANVHYNAGNLWQTKKDFERAVEEYDRALAGDNSRYPTWFNRGNALRTLGRYEEAANSYGQAARRKKTFFNAHLRQGQMLEKAGDLANARHAFQNAVNLRRGSFDAQLSLGRVCGHLGDRACAVEHLDAALAIRPDDEEARMERSRL